MNIIYDYNIYDLLKIGVRIVMVREVFVGVNINGWLGIKLVYKRLL